jgi:hypothetical protein
MHHLRALNSFENFRGSRSEDGSNFGTLGPHGRVCKAIVEIMDLTRGECPDIVHVLLMDRKAICAIGGAITDRVMSLGV